MSNIVIKVEHLSKEYQLGEVGTGSFIRDFQRFWAKRRGIEDPFQKVDVKFRSGKHEIHKALEDINFEINQGEVVGIIGKNGAGKSTLLKILSRVTNPSGGAIKIKGRISSLLEVGTGFHPDLTGKENIFLNGAILGMSKVEISKKFDEIVDFSGVEKFINTPVKRYSSGMYVRLAFAVAAHLEPEILIVDEVLAVGDAEFQNKCLGKMKDVSSQGRTVLFVSHTMSAIKSLCTRGLLLKDGKIGYDGDVLVAVDKYLSQETDMSITGIIPDSLTRSFNNGKAKFRKVEVVSSFSGKPTNQLYFREKFIANIEFDVFKEKIEDAIVNLMIGTIDGTIVFYTESFGPLSKVLSFNEGKHFLGVEITDVLQPGTYSVYLAINHQNGNTIDWVERAYDFTVLKTSLEKNNDYIWDTVHGYVNAKSNWTIN